ncbi:MAG: DsrE family protein [Actinobacteria bacterium]|nr:DsrE family protein [Actinomycetota bacterium]
MAQTLTFLLMDPPYESETTTTAFRLIDAALRRGHTVNVFAYEGAVNLTMADQAPHPNPVHGTDVAEEQHPLTKDWVAALFEAGAGNGGLNWINCGLCVDERGAGNTIEGPVRGGPAHFAEWAASSDATLVIPTR